jgi:acetolactate decarboxylase
MNSSGKWALTIIIVIVVACSAFLAGWQIQTNNTSSSINRETVYQLAAFNTFSTGKYSGFITYNQIEQHGNFGIGTFDGLNGEMLAFDGVFYQIPSDGVPRVADSAQTSPHATVTYFDPDLTYSVSNLNYTGLKSYLDSQLATSEDTIYAIKVAGNFSYIQARSPAKQSEPYPNLTDALKTQSVFNFTNVEATAVGYLFPSSMNGVDPAGYHLHIITDDKTAGGHLLECQIENASIQVDIIKNYTLILP